MIRETTMSTSDQGDDVYNNNEEQANIIDDCSSDYYVLGVDVGGSHISAGLMVNGGALVGEVVALPNDADSEESLITLIVTVLRPLLLRVSAHRIRGVGIGMPGQVAGGVLVAASNLPYLKCSDLAASVARLIHLPVALFNDANCAIAAEVLGQEAQQRRRHEYINNDSNNDNNDDSSTKYEGVRTAAMVTLGTGVGLGLLVGGRLHSGARGLIEGGHSILVYKGRPCACGQAGCAETYVSANSVCRRYIELLSSRSSTHADDDKVNMTRLLDDGAKTVFARAREGDVIAAHVIDETAEYLALFCVNLSRVLDPDVIILGGGLSLSGNQLLIPVLSHIQRLSWSVLDRNIHVCLASNAVSAGVVGAAMAFMSNNNEQK